MDFSWGWVKPGSVTTEPQAKVRLELARPAMPQAMRHPIARSRPGRRGGSRACTSACRCLRFRRSNRTCGRRLLLRQLGNCQFHGTLDRDASKAFGFVDPTISLQILVGFLA